MIFKSVSIILPTIRETESFVQAVRTVLEMNDLTDGAEVADIILNYWNDYPG